MAEHLDSKAWDWSLVPADSWNKVSDEYLPVAFRWKQLQKRTVLDLGCGRGRHSIFLAQLGFEVTAVDLSPEGIDQLQTQAKQLNLNKNIKTLVCDMLELPFGKGTFDCVLAFNSVYHTDYSGLIKIIDNITSYLADSGQLYITFSSKSSQSYNSPANKKIDNFTIVKTQGIEKGIPHTYLDHDEIAKLMSGYRILKIQHIQSFLTGIIDFRYFVEAEKKPES